MTGTLRVVVLGGYGNFGRIVARRLERSPGFDVVVAGRDGSRGTRLDIDASDFGESLSGLRADMVIHAAGPFQRQEYRVARAALAAGMHYIDLADSREFVCGIGALDQEARGRGRLVVSGASSVPALSSAVIDHLAPRFGAIFEIDVGISASATLPGRATIDGVLSYCGKPIPGDRHGWQGLRRREFRLARMARWLCDCDVPDLELFPPRYGAGAMRFGAGVELAPVQFGLWGMSWLSRAGLVPDPVKWSPFLARIGSALSGIGTGRSAMFVRVAGRGRDARPLELVWELFAQGDKGRQIPCMASVALARKLAAGALDVRGAMPCVGLVKLHDYLEELRELEVATHVFE